MCSVAVTDKHTNGIHVVGMNRLVLSGTDPRVACLRRRVRDEDSKVLRKRYVRMMRIRS